MNDHQINLICKSSVKFFEATKDEPGYRFMASFPVNSCEVASGFVAIALAEIYPKSEVVVVRAQSHSRCGMHFWVEIDEWVIDATIHQFQGYKAPIAQRTPSPAEQTFYDMERLSPADGAQNLEELGMSKPFIREVTQHLINRIREG